VPSLGVSGRELARAGLVTWLQQVLDDREERVRQEREREAEQQQPSGT
jgi:hypothetical protein